MRTLARAASALLLGAVWARPAVAADDATAPNDSEGYTPDDPGSALTIGGYLDIGFANAQGNGTSFHPDDTRLPADYGVDTFAPAVNSRGEVASTDAGGRFTNGFLPRSAGIGGRPSTLVNTLSLDLRYDAPGTPLMVFSRVQLLPRAGTGDARVLVEQAFGRLTPFDAHDLSVSVGKFDSVFGIEYLDNQAPLRVGVTPSLLARYTTGPSVGAKVFYRRQIAPLWSAISLHVAATNSGAVVESLQSPDTSLSGRPVASARLGYELNLPRVQVKLGASGLTGPRNDQSVPDVHQRSHGVDARLTFLGLALSGEYLRVDHDAGIAAEKVTGAGPQTLVSEFHARGFYAQAAYSVPWAVPVLGKVTAYGRFEQRHAWFDGFTAVTVQRVTAGVRLDLTDALILKGELLFNRERAGAPTVPNDVQALSLVYYW
jgi:hypothetical protein